MKSKFIYQSIVVLTIVVVALNACRHELLHQVNDNNSGTPLPTTSCNPDSVYFVSQVMPLISSNCTMSGCHDNISHADGVNLTSYTRIMQYVVPGNAGNSKLYRVVNRTDDERMPPSPMPPFTAEQKAIIQKWINQGARNNNCVGSCDTTVFTYTGAIKPILDYKCVGCHNPSNLGGNIDVAAYNAVRVIALNGKLYGSIAHQVGYSPMPKNSAKLSDCEIRQVQKWIGAGALNN